MDKSWQPKSVRLLLDAKKWLLVCIHPDISANAQLIKQLQSYQQVQQPQVERDQKCGYHSQLKLRVSGGFGLWPEFSRILKELVPAKDAPWSQEEEDDVISAIMLILCLAQTVDFGNQRGLRSQEEFIIEAEQAWVGRLESPFSPQSLRVRRILAKSNFLGLWNFLQHFVKPNLGQSNGFLLGYRWMMPAACHPDVDPSGRLKAFQIHAI